VKPQLAPDAPFAGGTDDLVQLDRDHPGFRDRLYRDRRNTIAQQALDYREGQPVPRVAYTDVEHDVWRQVWDQLRDLHAERAADAYLEAARRLALDEQRVPQLEDVNQQLRAATGFSMLPVAGLVSARMFLAFLAKKMFLSTQYVRHHSRPFYTPEPDVIHELIGHAATLVSDPFCALSEIFGNAMLAADNEAREAQVGRLYWYTLEFGLVDERGGPKAYGAGLLSSFGELDRCLTEAELQPFDVETIVETPFDPTDYQATLFVTDSLEQIERETTRWVATWA
jgi:phenylalanine-4-hydroxylase